jgi:hypothetical protein
VSLCLSSNCHRSDALAQPWFFCLLALISIRILQAMKWRQIVSARGSASQRSPDARSQLVNYSQINLDIKRKKNQKKSSNSVIFIKEGIKPGNRT